MTGVYNVSLLRFVTNILVAENLTSTRTNPPAFWSLGQDFYDGCYRIEINKVCKEDRVVTRGVTYRALVTTPSHVRRLEVLSSVMTRSTDGTVTPPGMRCIRWWTKHQPPKLWKRNPSLWGNQSSWVSRRSVWQKKYNNSITSITCDLTGPIELDPNYVLLWPNWIPSWD